jgi:hypothetical protein
MRLLLLPLPRFFRLRLLATRNRKQSLFILPLATASPLIAKPISPIIAMSNNPEEPSALTALALPRQVRLGPVPVPLTLLDGSRTVPERLKAWPPVTKYQ